MRKGKNEDVISEVESSMRWEGAYSPGFKSSEAKGKEI